MTATAGALAAFFQTQDPGARVFVVLAGGRAMVHFMCGDRMTDGIVIIFTGVFVVGILFLIMVWALW